MIMATIVQNTFWNAIIAILCLTYVVSVYGNLTIDSTRYQLIEYRDSVKVPGIITTSFGSPLDSVTASLTAGPKGPTLLQDVSFYDTLSRFDRERIPERVVHAKGAGALGYFEVTHDITKYSKAVIFSAIGKKTNIAIRFSQVTGESGSADTVRDPRGFAIKFYSEDGIFDLVGNNTPIFFIRDAILFPNFIHSIKRNPVTHLHDADMFWDFMTLRPETTHQLMVLFSDRGIPDGYRYMHGYGSNTFKLVNKFGEAVYCKFHFRSDQGIRNLPVHVANNLTSTDPDYSLRDLYNAIHQGRYPSWSAFIQVMTIEESNKNLDIAFDVTKIWPKDKFPLIPVGKLVLNANHKDYFSGVEQAGFSPNRMIPGIEPSPDKMLQGRLFSYPDTQYHRLGVNYLQLPINDPRTREPKNYERDGAQTIYNQDGAPNYFPNSYKGPVEDPNAKLKPFPVPGNVDRYETKDDDNYSQPKNLWKNILNDGERQRMVENIAGNAVNAHVATQKRVVSLFSNVDKEFGQRLAVQLGISNIVNIALK